MKNPYASPSFVPDEQPFAVRDEARPTFRGAFLRWTLICCGSAIPSFFWGMTIGNSPIHIGAMVVGIFCFVLVYSAIECSDLYHSISQNPLARRTLMIGYGTRLAASIIFPVGLFLDMFLGAFAVNITNWLFTTNLVSDKAKDDFAFAFVTFFVTTLIQGVFLNALLFGFMAFVFGVQWLWVNRFLRTHPESDLADTTGTL